MYLKSDFNMSAGAGNLTGGMLPQKIKAGPGNRLSEIVWLQSHRVRVPLANNMGLIPLLNFSKPADTESVFILESSRSARERLDEKVREVCANTASVTRAEYLEQYTILASQC